MKKLFSLLIMMISLISFGQIEVSEKNVSVNGSHNGFYIAIPYGDKKFIEKELKDELKSWKGNYKGGNPIFVDDCKLKDVGDNTFDVYAKVEENSDGGANVSIAIDMGGAYMNSNEHGAEFKAMESRLYKWAVKAAQSVVDGEIKDEEKALKDLEKDLSDSEKEQEKLEKEIEDFKKKIEDNEKAVEDAKKAQDDKKSEITDQEKKVEEAKKKKDAVK